MAIKKPKPVIITVTKTRRKTQPFTFSIDMPGNAAKQTKAEYYTRSTTARTGALRQIGAWRSILFKRWFVGVKGSIHPIEFVSVNLAKK